MLPLFALTVLVSAVAAYHNTFRAPFIFDDVDSIQSNPHIRRLWPLRDALAAPPESPVSGRPVVSFSLAINYALGGMDVGGYHAFNLLAHVVNALLLLGVVRRTLRAGALGMRCQGDAEWLAASVALLWTVHPLLTESVTYVTQRTELLVGTFLLLTLYCVIRGAASGAPRAWYAAAVAACAFGMASKQVMVVAPVIVLLYDRIFVSGSFAQALRRRRSLYGGLALTWFLLVALLAANPRPQSVGLGFSNLTPVQYAFTQCGVIVHYLRLAVWPHPLVLDYAWPTATSPAEILLPATVLAILGAATYWAFRRQPWLGFLGAWFFVMLAPTSSLVPIRTEFAAERRMYLPLVALVALVVAGAHAALERMFRQWGWADTRRRSLEGMLVVALAVTLGAVTVRRNDDYRSEIAIWSDTVVKQPHNVRARINLADSLERDGHLDQAIDEYAAALRIAPNFAMLHNHLGFALVQRGRVDEAIAHYAEALRINPRYALAHSNLGTALEQRGRLDEAIAHYAEAVRIDPQAAMAHYFLGTALAAHGRSAEAAQHLERAASLGVDGARRALEDLRRVQR